MPAIRKLQINDYAIVLNRRRLVPSWRNVDGIEGFQEEMRFEMKLKRKAGD